MVAGAAEAPLAPLTFGAFDVLHALSRNNINPPAPLSRSTRRATDL